ncbi:hypothetical protein FGB62_402g00 [Gracilaria domingensis]|nr:hypothetical protein FGB62_402g00 [Gracilaria domingensis]
MRSALAGDTSSQATGGSDPTRAFDIPRPEGTRRRGHVAIPTRLTVYVPIGGPIILRRAACFEICFDYQDSRRRSRRYPRGSRACPLGSYALNHCLMTSARSDPGNLSPGMPARC